MNSLIRKFFQEEGSNFQEVLFLNEKADATWEDISEILPTFLAAGLN